MPYSGEQFLLPIFCIKSFGLHDKTSNDTQTTSEFLLDKPCTPTNTLFRSWYLAGIFAFCDTFDNSVLAQPFVHTVVTCIEVYARHLMIRFGHFVVQPSRPRTMSIRTLRNGVPHASVHFDKTEGELSKIR